MVGSRLTSRGDVNGATAPSHQVEGKEAAGRDSLAESRRGTIKIEFSGGQKVDGKLDGGKLTMKAEYNQSY
jgi:hypothetical protein